MVQLVPLADVDPAAVEALLDRAFEPGRRARTAYRLRAGTEPIARLSFAAVEGGALAGSIQCWPVRFVPGDGGRSVPVTLVGPVAVAPERQGTGTGGRLMRAALAAADAGGEGRAMALIGDPEYYGRFGFTAARTGGWTLPGPWEARRLLARGAGVPAGAGVLGPPVAADVPG